MCPRSGYFFRYSEDIQNPHYLENLHTFTSGVNFIQKKLSKKKLSTNKWRKKYYPEDSSKNFFIQINATLYHTNDATPLYIKEKIFSEQKRLISLIPCRTHCNKTGTRPPSCPTPWQLTIYVSSFFTAHYLDY